MNRDELTKAYNEANQALTDFYHNEEAPILGAFRAGEIGVDELFAMKERKAVLDARFDKLYWLMEAIPEEEEPIVFEDEQIELAI